MASNRKHISPQRSALKAELYKTSLSSIGKYFGVSELCSLYLYHRSFRSRRKDEKHMQWNVKLQNALIKADKCLGIDWNDIRFGEEVKNLESHGIIVDEMPNTVFKWTDDDEEEEKAKPAADADGWTTVTSKKRKKKKKPEYNIMLVKRPGLFI